MAKEGVPPLLAVGDDIEAGGFLKGERFVHRPIFDALELGGGEVTSFDPLARIDEIRRTEQAADPLATT